MPVRGVVIGNQIEEYHETTAYEHVMCNLEPRVRMVNAKVFEERSVIHDHRLFVPCIQRQTFSCYTFTHITNCLSPK